MSGHAWVIEPQSKSISLIRPCRGSAAGMEMQAARKHGDLTMVGQGREMQAEAKRLLRIKIATPPSHLKPDND